jgi:hypothetical protein
MDLRINEITSNVVAADRNTFLSPDMLRSIVEAVLAEMERRRHLNQSAEDERELQRGVAPRPGED